MAATVDFLKVRQALTGDVEVPAELRIGEDIRRETPAGESAG